MLRFCNIYLPKHSKSKSSQSFESEKTIKKFSFTFLPHRMKKNFSRVVARRIHSFHLIIMIIVSIIISRPRRDLTKFQGTKNENLTRFYGIWQVSNFIYRITGENFYVWKVFSVSLRLRCDSITRGARRVFVEKIEFSNLTCLIAKQTKIKCERCDDDKLFF